MTRLLSISRGNKSRLRSDSQSPTSIASSSSSSSPSPPPPHSSPSSSSSPISSSSSSSNSSSNSNSYGSSFRKAKLALMGGSIFAVCRVLMKDFQLLTAGFDTAGTTGFDFDDIGSVGTTLAVSVGTSLSDLFDWQDGKTSTSTINHVATFSSASSNNSQHMITNTRNPATITIKNEATNNKAKAAKTAPFIPIPISNFPNASDFPTTPFTEHVLEVLSVIENVTLHASPTAIDRPPLPYDPTAIAPERAWSFHIIVDKPFSLPSKIECSRSVKGRHWCTNFIRLFQQNQSRIIPFNVTFGIHGGDFILPNAKGYGQLVGSSSLDGKFLMNNYEDSEIQEEYILQKNQTLIKTRGMVPSLYARGMIWDHSDIPLWENKHTIPVFRGHPRMEFQRWNNDPTTCPKDASDMGHRMKAAAFSIQYPNLLNAVLRKQDNVVCARYNTTNGMDRIFRWGKYSSSSAASPSEKNATTTTTTTTSLVQPRQLPHVQIPAKQYYTHYQTALVLGGWGAAFRTASHLSAGQAVVLQDFVYREWFIHLMEPFIHYIPLQRDLSDLKERMEWIQNHPSKVKQIAKNGKTFYWEYLSFDKFQEHWYEFMWRLSILLYERGGDRQDVWNGSSITWHDKSGPLTFQRTASGTYESI